jgi:hypothetical protein
VKWEKPDGFYSLQITLKINESSFTCIIIFLANPFFAKQIKPMKIAIE